MTDWQSHILKGFSQNGTLAYAWHRESDTLSWAGDAMTMLGQASMPAKSDAFSTLVNPQKIPERLLALHNLMNGETQSMSLSYGIRHNDGHQIEIEETAEWDAATGTVYGFIRPAALPAVTRIAPDNLHPLHEGPTAHNGRLKLQTSVEEWLQRKGEHAHSTGFLLVVGLDRFALYNEAFGARFSNEIIDRVCHRLRQIAGQNAEVARIDGDVFGMFFHMAQHGEMTVFAKYIISNLCDYPLETSKGPLTVGASIGGIVLQPSMRMDNATIVTSAEMAMHKAKDKGRACFVSYDEASAEAHETRSILKTADEFMLALKQKRVRLAFQPVMDMQQNKVRFHEGLIRMVDPHGRMQAASQFVPAIEKLGLCRTVDHFALRTTIEELSLFSDLSLSVNVSQQTLADPEWLRNIVSLLRDRPSVAQRMIVEITETCAVLNMSSIVRIVKTLKDLGCRVALDDFGAGYTAFLQLKELDVDIVKIDKAFIRDINGPESQLFVKTLQELANGVNMQTVAEGAETLADARLLANRGINMVQGYVYGFPQVERVWLPKEHNHRKISFDFIPTNEYENTRTYSYF